jgi:subtilisin family serine protease
VQAQSARNSSADPISSSPGGSALPPSRPTPLDVTGLSALMALTSGLPAIRIGLIDGPVAVDDPDLAGAQAIPVANGAAACSQPTSRACIHGTYVARILSGRRGSDAAALCPDCTLLVRPIFKEEDSQASASLEDLAAAVRECVDAGAHVLNISSALARPSTAAQRELEAALDIAMRRGTLVVAAAGNQGILGSTVITRHPWVIPVAACDLDHRPVRWSNLGHSIGRNGLMAPGAGLDKREGNAGAGAADDTTTAAALVSGAVALLRSVFPGAGSSEIRRAVTRSYMRRTSVVPPVLDAMAAHQQLAAARLQGSNA